MPILSELSHIVKRRRCEMGLSQERLAKLAGLPCSTIMELELGVLTDLSAASAERMVNTLGLGLGVTGAYKTNSGRDTIGALETAARSGSISYRDTIPKETLRRALLDGVIPPNYLPQLRALLDEAPMKVLYAVAAQLEAENAVSRAATWQKMHQLAAMMACTRDIWL